MTALTLVQAQSKVDAFVARFGQKAEQTAVDFITSNVDVAALDSLTEVVSAFQTADSSLNGAITSLAASASSATATVQSNLSTYITANEAHVALVEAKVDYAIDHLPHA